MENSAPIGVFDSGNGGISVLKELITALPHEDYIYYGDDKHAPYGERSKEEIVALSKACAQLLIEKGAKAIVVACNTATAAAIEQLRSTFSVPFVAMEPATRPALAKLKDGKILVMATHATLSLDMYQNRLAELGLDENRVISLPCSQLVAMLQKGQIDAPSITAELSRLFLPYQKETIDAVVLGCTHYVHIKPYIEDTVKKLWPHSAVIDGNAGTARQLKTLLQEKRLLNPKQEQGSVTLLSSDTSKERKALNEMLLHLNAIQ